MNITVPEIQSQWNRFAATPLCNLLIQEATRVSLPPGFVAAIASRETNLINELGDGNHGVGLIQIDVRYHPIALYARDNGLWQSEPGPLIAFGCDFLNQNLYRAKMTFPGLTLSQYLKFTASAYNAGFGGASEGHADGNSDLHTTGGDYGADVMDRYVIFAGLVAMHIMNHPGCDVPGPVLKYPGF